MKKKRGTIIAAIIIVIILISTASIIIHNRLNSENNFPIKNLFTKTQDYSDKNQDKIVQEHFDDTKETATPAAGGGGGGSSGGKGSESSQQTCSYNQISYSLIEPNKTTVCNEYQDNFCINKTITCYVKVNNRDQDVNGNFEIELIFLEKRKMQNDSFNPITSRFYLEALGKHTFGGSATINSTGEDGLANQDINCFYNTIKVPEKKNCV